VVANRTVNGEQCYIVWNVDDLKISHGNPNAVTEVIWSLSKAFGKEAPLTITCGKAHNYLGMTFDYSSPGKVKIIMVDCIKKILDDMPPNLTENQQPQL
jgi:hypothetical protein